MKARDEVSRPSVRGASWFVGGFLFAVVALSGVGWLYMADGKVPVAVADQPFPFEHRLVDVALNGRIERENQNPPFFPTEAVYEAGASIYRKQCAFCHGTPTQESQSGKWMYPKAPQLWMKHLHSDVVGVSDDEPGETFWKVKNGIRLTGMPAYSHELTETQVWDVSLLLKAADQPISDSVRTILTERE
jgi:thiosulfate dehydrogenase